ncbi:hypothetical protein HNY73_017429 [Argiope bruennichi]|uniref:Uncharacterized protein n=1 Tax=Argiope bruennichi TaxID=94029 RepID=A0A8T0E9L9_ARGBR|nr:hypothetical protein HNY73_017429 [Argiope bruennichi]
MAILGEAFKADLQNLTENLGVVVGASSTVLGIKTAIQAMPNFEKEVDYIKELLETLRTARLEVESWLAEERRWAAE